MRPWGAHLSVPFLCFGLIVATAGIALSKSDDDTIPEPFSFESIPPDRMKILDPLQLVRKEIGAMSARVSNTDKRLEAQDTTVLDTQGLLKIIRGEMDTGDGRMEAHLGSKREGKLNDMGTELAAIGKKVETLDNTANNEVSGKLNITEAKLGAIMDREMTGKLSLLETKLEGVSSGIEATTDMLGQVESAVHSLAPLGNNTENDCHPRTDVVGELSLEPNVLASEDLGSTEVEQQRQELITTILNVTRSRFYTGLNLTGEFYDYDLKNFSESAFEGCITLPRNDFKSVETYNGCIRIFSSSICLGPSLAVYQGADNFPDIINSNFTRFKSIGPCFPNEFEFSAVLNGTNGVTVTKNGTNTEEIPDQTLIGYSAEYLSKCTSVSSAINPVTNYHLDIKNNKILFIRAKLHKRHLTQSAPPSQIKGSAPWNNFDKKEGDDLGFVIPPSMSGPGNESYNIFPQSGLNAVEWSKVLSQVPDFVVEEVSSNYFILDVNFVYPNEGTSRPNGFYYQADIFPPYMQRKVIYGFIKN